MTTPPTRGRPRGLVPGSRAEQLLAIARSLGTAFADDDLAVAAFHADPARFAMTGYPCPDAIVACTHLNSLVRRGYVVRAGKGRYRVKEGA